MVAGGTVAVGTALRAAAVAGTAEGAAAVAAVGGAAAGGHPGHRRARWQWGVALVLWNTLDWDLDGSVTADERLGALGPRALDPLADEAGDPIALDERDLPETCAAADPAYTTKGVVLTCEVHHEARIKIMVMEAALRNQPRFNGKRTLVLTGERADESPKRATYKVFQPHRANIRTRHIDVWRPVHRWTKAEVWALVETYRIAVHPGYRLGWGRLSCAACIFGSPDQWASLRTVNPRQFHRVGAYERELNYTINMKGKTVLQMADEGRPFPNMRDEDIRAALSPTFDEPIFVAHWIPTRRSAR